MRMINLLPNFYVSGWPDIMTLDKEHFDTIITVCRKELPEELKQKARVAIHWPISDTKEIPPEHSDIAELIVESVIAEQKTLVHCYLGRNRSMLCAAVAYSNLTNCHPREAFNEIRRLQPSSFYNETFVEYLTR